VRLSHISPPAIVRGRSSHATPDRRPAPIGSTGGHRDTTALISKAIVPEDSEEAAALDELHACADVRSEPVALLHPW
jgi:hypothetical protein